MWVFAIFCSFSFSEFFGADIALPFNVLTLLIQEFALSLYVKCFLTIVNRNETVY